MGTPSIFVVSTYGFSGKTAICLGLALKAMDVGLKTGYIKPIGRVTSRGRSGQLVDDDAVLMKETLKMQSPLDAITPILLDLNYLEERKRMTADLALEKIKEAYSEIPKDTDFIVIEGLSTVHSGAFIGIPAPKIASTLGSRMLLIGVPENDSIVDEVLRDKIYSSYWNVDLAGVIFNNIRPQMASRVDSVIRPVLEETGVATLGTIPEYIELTAPTVNEIFEVLGGEFLVEGENVDRLVSSLLVGAMAMDRALEYFRKSVNKAVITGGDRSDIALAALETSTSVLILTGNVHPNVKVLSRARETQIPVILVPHDTYTTIKMIEGITGRIRPQDEKRIAAAKNAVDENVEWRRILNL